MGFLAILVAAINLAIGLALALRVQCHRYVWWLVGAQLVTVVIGVSVLLRSGALSGGYASVTRDGSTFMVCVVGPLGIVMALMAMRMLRLIPGAQATQGHGSTID